MTKTLNLHNEINLERNVLNEIQKLRLRPKYENDG